MHSVNEVSSMHKAGIPGIPEDDPEVSETEVFDTFFEHLGRKDLKVAKSICYRFALEGMIRHQPGISISLIASPGGNPLDSNV